MSVDSVRDYLRAWDRNTDVLEFPVSSATVALAAEALRVNPSRIAKTLCFTVKDRCILIVTAGDAKIDNALYKAQFGCKAKMPAPDEVLTLTGHAVGGVCPFALVSSEITVYTDVSLKRFDTVFPACGSGNSAIELSCDELFQYSRAAGWIDVCKDWRSDKN